MHVKENIAHTVQGLYVVKWSNRTTSNCLNIISVKDNALDNVLMNGLKQKKSPDSNSSFCLYHLTLGVGSPTNLALSEKFFPLRTWMLSGDKSSINGGSIASELVLRQSRGD